MNARVDPATLRSPDDGGDAALIAKCKLAIRALEKEIEMTKARFDIEGRHYASLPPYPLNPDQMAVKLPHYTARQLRAVRDDFGHEIGREKRELLEAQIQAVDAWEKVCAGLRQSSGLPKADRLVKRARAKAVACVRAVIDLPARTHEGSARKSLVLAYWLDAGWGLDGAGEEIVRSIIADARRNCLVETALSQPPQRAA